MKVRVAASLTGVSVLLALSSYGVRLDDAVHHFFARSAKPAEGKASGRQHTPRDLAVLANLATIDADPLTAYIPENAANRLMLAVADGQTLAAVLAAADVPPAEAQGAIEAARRVYDTRRLRTGQFVTIEFAQADGPFQGFEILSDPDHVVTVTRSGGAFAARQTQIPLHSEPRAVKGVIRSSLFEATAGAGIPYAVTAAMIRAFSYDVDFQRDLQPGDRFKVMYDTKVSDGGSRPGDLLFAELVLSGKSHMIYGVRRDDGTLDFFTRDGRSVKKSLLKTPVDGARLTSGFGMRMHPILGFTRMHKGVDFGVPTGTPIYAAGDGVIEYAGWAGGYGRYVKIRHNNRTETAYGHMSRFAACAETGQHVFQGEVIGFVGMTGDATGPHLHYEVLKDGNQVNPISVIVPLNTGLEGNEFVAFQKTVVEREKRVAALIEGVQVAEAPRQP